MKVKQIQKLIDDVALGEVFQHDESIWIKTNSSHDKAGYQCVELSRGTLMYINKNTKVTEVKAELQVITAVPKQL